MKLHYNDCSTYSKIVADVAVGAYLEKMSKKRLDEIYEGVDDYEESLKAVLADGFIAETPDGYDYSDSTFRFMILYHNDIPVSDMRKLPWIGRPFSPEKQAHIDALNEFFGRGHKAKGE